MNCKKTPRTDRPTGRDLPPKERFPKVNRYVWYVIPESIEEGEFRYKKVRVLRKEEATENTGELLYE